MPKTRLFLERRSYRRRRMMDVVRVLPLLCSVLWLVVPTMWPNSTEGVSEIETSLSTAIWYLIAVWVLGICATFALWRRIRNDEHEDELHPFGAADN